MDVLKKAFNYHQNGNVKKALRLYLSVLKQNPQIADVHHLIGISYRQLGQPRKGLPYLKHAVTMKPKEGSFRANLARCLYDLSDLPTDECLLEIDHALQLDPTLFETWGLKTMALRKLDRVAEASEMLAGILKKYPDDNSLNQNYGAILIEEGRSDEALPHLEKVQKKQPNNIALVRLMARAQAELGDFDTAKILLNVVLKSDQRDIKTHFEAARILHKCGDFADAYPHMQIVIDKAPPDATHLMTMGVILLGMTRYGEALSFLRAARQTAPSSRPEVDFNLSLGEFANGELETAWDNYNRRHSVPKLKGMFKFDIDRHWRGEDLTGKRLLVWRDQGIGDALRSAPLLQDLEKTGADVTLAMPPKLMSLFARSYPNFKVINQEFKRADEPDEDGTTYDYVSGLDDLGMMYRRSWADFDRAQFPALTVDEDHVSSLRKRLNEASPGPYVGVSWRSGNLAANRIKGYLSIKDFAPILNVPGVTFVNLQYGADQKELDWVRNELGVPFINFDEIDLKDDIDSAAALNTAVDLTITANTSVGDIAGTLGLPCWRFGLRHEIFLLGKDTPPWYDATDFYVVEPGSPATDIVPCLVQSLDAWVKNSAAISAKAS